MRSGMAYRVRGDISHSVTAEQSPLVVTIVTNGEIDKLNAGQVAPWRGPMGT